MALACVYMLAQQAGLSSNKMREKKDRSWISIIGDNINQLLMDDQGFAEHFLIKLYMIASRLN